MRIFHINGDRGIPPNGSKGASIHRRELIGALLEGGHEVTAFSRRAGVDSVAYADAFDLATHARRHGRPDVVYERYSIGHLHGLRTAEALAVPFVLEVNAPLLLEAERYRGYAMTLHDVAAEVELFRRASVVRTVSSWLSDHVAERRGHTRRVVVIPNGHNPAAYPTPPTFDGPRTVTFLGHPKPWHGADQLIGLGVDLSRYLEQWRMVIIGGGEGADAIADAAAAAGFRERVRITGPVGQTAVTAELRAAWVGVAPYGPTPAFYFSPLKVLDYLGAGLPVVASNLGDLSRLIGDGGTTVDAADPDAFASAVAVYLTDRRLACETGAAGRARARRQHTWAGVASSIIAAIERLPVPVGA